MVKEKEKRYASGDANQREILFRGICKDVNNTQIQIVGTVTVPVPGMSVDLVCLLFYQRAIRIDRDGHVTLIY